MFSDIKYTAFRKQLPTKLNSGNKKIMKFKKYGE